MVVEVEEVRWLLGRSSGMVCGLWMRGARFLVEVVEDCSD